jgi:hypothetical protein
MNKPEPIYLTESDAIDAFAPEPGSEPRRTARESSGEPLEGFQSEVSQSEVFQPEVFQSEVFQSEVFVKSDVFDVFEKSDAFAGSMRASVPLRTRPRVHPVSLVAVAGIAAIFAVVVMQQSNAPESMPTAPIASSTVGGSEASPVLPPVTSAPPSPSPSVPEPTVEPSQQTAAIAETPPPIAVQPAPPVRSEPPARSEALAKSEPPPTVRATAPEPPRLPRPLSQDPARLAAGVTTPSRTSVDVPPAPRPTTPASVSSPPVETPAATPPASASASSSSSVPPPSVASTPSPSPPAVTPPTTAATTEAPAAATAAVRPPVSAAGAPAAAAAVIDTNTAGIQNALARYRQAFNSLSASATREVWPTVNERSLSRAFDRLEEQQVSFDGCQIQVNQERAEAVCNGSARYVPRVGSRTPRVERRQWRFSLVKTRGEWLIGAVDAR